MTHDDDMTRVHYRLAGGTTLCGAISRVGDRVARGEVPDRHAVLKVKATTDVRRITCPVCRKFVAEVVISWHRSDTPNEE